MKMTSLFGQVILLLIGSPSGPAGRWAELVGSGATVVRWSFQGSGYGLGGLGRRALYGRSAVVSLGAVCQEGSQLTRQSVFGGKATKDHFKAEHMSALVGLLVAFCYFKEPGHP